MIDTCARHRPYLAAFADGEVELVPDATREHVTVCAVCAAEVADHGLVGERLRDAFRQQVQANVAHGRRYRGFRRRAAVLLAAGVLLVGGVGAGGVWRLTHAGADPVAIALAAAQDRPSLVSSDPTMIRAWCTDKSDRPGPPVSLPTLTPVGARMDTSDGTTIVTVFYRSTSSDHVAIGWLDAATQAPSRSRVEERTVSGRPVLVVETPVGTAVLSGDSIGMLWASAATLQSVTG